jgi:BirA family transcriptional regulator, biotin operon repressor / biotin---[acetyl-CoA-carboxylase] ligase
LGKINPVFIGKIVHHFPSLGSTNAYAADYLANNDPNEGTVISAGFQHQGRGQVGSSWQSEADKNLLLSIILYPHFLDPYYAFRLNMAVALGVAETIRQFIPGAVAIKWPNDIYIDDRKVAGILLQNGIAGRRMQWTVAGVGLNVNQTVFDAALPNPTSLALENGKPLELTAVRETLFYRIEGAYLQLKRDPAALQKAYLSALYRFGEPAPFLRTAGGRRFTGRITGVTDTGRLMIDTDLGLQTFDLKEIQFEGLAPAG